MSAAAFRTESTAPPDETESALGDSAPWLWRDLARDWQRWTVTERIAAGALLAGIAATPVVALARAML